MKKLILIVIFVLTQCGYQPIHLNNNSKNFEFNKITYQGNSKINKKIINVLSLKENRSDKNLNDLSLKSYYEIKETKKNSKGRVVSYRSKINLNLIIKNNNQVIANKDFVREFSYNTKDNKFDLIQYQNEIKKNLIDEIIEDIILFMNI